MGVLRNPFVVSLVIAVVASAIGLIAAVALTFSDINNAPVPARIMGRAYSDHFRAFVRKNTGGVDFAGTIGDSIDGIIDVVPSPPSDSAPPPVGARPG